MKSREEVMKGKGCWGQGREEGEGKGSEEAREERKACGSANFSIPKTTWV